MQLIIDTVIPLAVTGLCGAFVALLKMLLLLRRGIVAMMRDRLLQSCKYWLKEGYMPLDERPNLEEMYLAYHANKGNGVVTDVYTRAIALPYEPVKKEVANVD